MSRKAAPSFRQITVPLDIPDSDLHHFAEKAGVPTMRKVESSPTTETPRAPFSPPPANSAPELQASTKPDERRPDKITLELPNYLTRAVKRAAVDEDSTFRHIVIKGLQKLGFTVFPEDLIPDNRGIAAKMRRKT